MLQNQTIEQSSLLRVPFNSFFLREVLVRENRRVQKNSICDVLNKLLECRMMDHKPFHHKQLCNDTLYMDVRENFGTTKQLDEAFLDLSLSLMEFWLKQIRSF
jgi:hypothetical protein